MARPLPPGFKLIEAPLSDSDEMWRLCEIAFADDEIWKAAFSNVKEEDIHPWVMAVFTPRWNLPDISFYKIVEESSG